MIFTLDADGYTEAIEITKGGSFALRVYGNFGSGTFTLKFCDPDEDWTEADNYEDFHYGSETTFTADDVKLIHPGRGYIAGYLNGSTAPSLKMSLTEHADAAFGDRTTVPS